MFGWRIYNTVIMDGSSKFVNREITGIVDMMTRRLFGRSICRKFDRQYVTMRVIRRFTNAERYRQTKNMIEEFYPGICAFDVTI